MLNWREYETDFEFDGSWRDIYVVNTDVSDWQTLIEFLQSGTYQCSYFMADGNMNSTELTASMIFQTDDELSSRPVLIVSTGSVDLNCHFFKSQEIEFDFDPREVKSKVEAEQIFDFMSQVSRILKKDTILTAENSPGRVIFKANSSTDSLQYFSPGS